MMNNLEILQRAIESSIKFCSGKSDAQRKQAEKLFFSCVIYETAEIEQLLTLPVWPRYIRIAYVRLFGWLNPDVRDRLGIR